MRSEVIGFAPDLDPGTPGILTQCNNIIPTVQGMAAANSPINAGFPALASQATAGFVATLLDGTKRSFVSTATKIYEPITLSWVDRSRAGDYTGSNRTRFEVFGNAVLSTNRSQPIQQSTGGAFSDIATAPTALTLVSASGFMLAFNINGMTLGDVPDGWGCSAIRNHTLWTPSAATQSVAGRLLDSPGPILAAAALGGDVVAYKATSMYLGRYVGPPLVWAWTRIPGDIGCGGAEAVITVGTVQYFIGPSDFYVFDGTVPRPLESPVRQFFFDSLAPSRIGEVIAVSDAARNLIYWHYPSNGAPSGVCDSCLVYNTKTDRWGRFSYPITAALRYSQSQITYDSLGTTYSTYDSLPDIAYDSPFWIADSTVPGVINDRVLYSLTGEPQSSFYRTGFYGDMTALSMMRRWTPSYLIPPTSATAFAVVRPTFAGDQTALPKAPTPWFKGRFDFRHVSKWHGVNVEQNGRAVLNGYDVDLVQEGSQ